MLTGLAAFAWTDVVGGVLCMSAVVVFFWALFADRSKGRWRCAKCWYDLDAARSAEGAFATGGVTCPECGRVHASERALLRTRRRWSALVLTLPLLLLAAEISRLPVYRARGALGAIPTGVLVLLAPPDRASSSRGAAARTPPSVAVGIGAPPPPPAGPTTTLADEMWTRVWQREDWDWQRRFFLWRVAGAHHVELAGVLTAPDRWPAGLPVPIAFDDLPARRVLGGYLGRIQRTAQGPMIGAPHVESTCARDGLIEVRYDMMDTGLGSPFTLRCSRPIRIIEGDGPFLEPVTGATADDQVRGALRVRLVSDGTDARLLLAPAFDVQVWTKLGYGVAGRFVLRIGDRKIGGADMIASMFSATFDQERTVALEWEPGGAALAAARAERVTIEFRGDPKMAEELFVQHLALRIPGRAWAGSFVIPARAP